MFWSVSYVCIFFLCAQNFFLYALLCFHPFLVYGLLVVKMVKFTFITFLPNIFEFRMSSPFRSVPSVLRVHGSAPCVRARRSSFSPRRARKAERAFRVRIGRNVWLRMKVEDTQRAKRLCLGFHFSTFILVPSRVLFFLSESLKKHTQKVRHPQDILMCNEYVF